jgi:internalin A
MPAEHDAAYRRAEEKIEAALREGATELHLYDKGLTSVPETLGKLTALHEFSLYCTQLTSMPDALGKLTALQTLYLSNNQLTSVAEAVGKLTALRELFLSHNQLTSVPEAVGKLTALQSLWLSDNRLTSVPEDLGQLTALHTLGLNNNQLTIVPEALRTLCTEGKLKHLFLHGNPALGIPDSILGPTREEVFHSDPKQRKPAARPSDILDFYFSQRRGAASGTLREVGEVKVMLVGRGGAGKTSLRRFFLNESHDAEEPETPGIALDSFPVRCGTREVTVRLWDFAGQEITHALHQFFLTEGCVYLLVLDPRSNTEMRDAEYWLELLRRYAGGSPVVVALNRQDARQGGYDVDRRALCERFPFVREFVPTNCATRTGCEKLRRTVYGVIENLKDTELPHLKVPQSWLKVMQDCRDEGREKPAEKKSFLSRLLGLAGHGTRGSGSDAKGRQHLTLAEFRAICGRHGEMEPEKQESLARLLHRLGAVLHFVDEPRLRDTSVLNPHWVTDGVYRLLRFKDRPKSDGTLTLAEALEALPGETEETARFLLRLMERFEMCFPVDEDGAKPAAKWLIPGALDQFQPEEIGPEWQQPGRVRMRYVYDPLPEGVLPRFIVMTHPLSEGKPRWRNGVVLTESNAAALVRRGEKPNHIEVTAFGPEPERLRLLEIVQGNLERINADVPDPKPFAELELAGLPGVFRPVADLEAAERAEQAVIVSAPPVEAKVEPTPQLNQTSEKESRDPQRMPLNAFLSYSHEDKRVKGIFQNNLTVMMKKKFITPWHDGLIEPGMRWREEIEQSLGKMDVFVGLLTTAFLASDFIGNVEIKAARERLKTEGREFIFVLILVDDISLKDLDLAEYQILKPDGKAVSRHKSRKEGFDAAQKELEKLIAKRQAEKKEERRGEPVFERHVPRNITPQAGVTYIGKGDYVAADKSMNQDSHDFHIEGDVTNAQIGQTLTNCTNMIQQQAPGERKDLLEQLQQEVKALIAKLPEEKKEEAAGDLEQLVKGATAATPNRRWYSVSAEGLIEASKFVKDFAGNIVGTVGQLGKLLWPGFKLTGEE